jgi:hypothetical protein
MNLFFLGLIYLQDINILVNYKIILPLKFEKMCNPVPEAWLTDSHNCNIENCSDSVYPACGINTQQSSY